MISVGWRLPASPRAAPTAPAGKPWLPLIRGGDQLLCLSAMLAGRPVTALLDSGASRSVLDSGWAARAGLTPSAPQLLAGLTATATARLSKSLAYRSGGIKQRP